MDSREFKGLELAARAKIVRRASDWLVPSLSHQGSQRVNADGTGCTCEDFELRGLPCCYMLAFGHIKARDFVPAPRRPDLTPPESERPKKKTYPQQWAAYNKAATNEKRYFLNLLAELVGTVDEPERTGPGRKPISLRDGLFAAMFKVYSGFSARRLTTDLRDAVADGHATRAPHFNVVLRVLEDETVTPILRQLVTRSSLPLSGIETVFAVDSSGFGTSRYEKWFDQKYGVEKYRSTWVKTHLCVGTRTNIVTAVEIGDGHDGQYFPALVRATAENFTLGDVTADKAYLSRENLELVESLGGSPFIPFKAKTRPDRNGPTWERLWHQFALERESFLRRYHKRSNVEATFSAIKRVLGDSVRAKTPTAMANEVLAKLVCHNLRVVIHEMHELGIDPGFGPKTDEGDAPDVLKFPGNASRRLSFLRSALDC